MPVTIDSATLTQTFPANALAHELTVLVRADAAGYMKLNEVGQVRATASAVAGNSTYTSVVVDFGKPLTTGGAKVPAGVGLIRFVYKWRGDSFDTTTPVYSSPTTAGVAEASFPEVSSQRLQIELIGTVTQANAELVQVLLPSLPADLEVHVNDGPVAWRYPGPRGAPGVDGWESSANGTQKEVDLTAAIEPLLGDPDSATPVTVTVELRARTPGKLSVAGGTSDYDLLQKVPVTPDPDLDFEMEGDQSLLLNLPGGPATNLKEVWLTVAAAPPKERAVPAVGPDRVNEVELVLDSGRSACVRFPADVLADLTALRLPLHALDGSAEVRAQLLSPITVEQQPNEPPRIPRTCRGRRWRGRPPPSRWSWRRRPPSAGSTRSCRSSSRTPGRCSRSTSRCRSRPRSGSRSRSPAARCGGRWAATARRATPCRSGAARPAGPGWSSPGRSPRSPAWAGGSTPSATRRRRRRWRRSRWR